MKEMTTSELLNSLWEDEEPDLVIRVARAMAIYESDAWLSDEEEKFLYAYLRQLEREINYDHKTRRFL